MDSAESSAKNERDSNRETEVIASKRVKTLPHQRREFNNGVKCLSDFGLMAKVTDKIRPEQIQSLGIRQMETQVTATRLLEALRELEPGLTIEEMLKWLGKELKNWEKTEDNVVKMGRNGTRKGAKTVLEE